MTKLKAIVSGGQTGVDQAALLAARQAGLEVGGWCPPGRLCESGIIPSHFPLKETPEERSPDAPDLHISPHFSIDIFPPGGTSWITSQNHES